MPGSLFSLRHMMLASMRCRSCGLPSTKTLTSNREKIDMETQGLGGMLADMKSSQQEALAFQTEVNKQSMLFNSAMAAKDAEKKAWDKVHG
ncbi:hypothetical protein JCM7686_1770 [Paracoccus aminophilus JCM 7686]|uniref:Uncharacterized protein n=2 Tax=Paracoccus aminophilus TaxID=34003 RepID=S5YUF0_PARAH|nr:hypothetical protein JCM7686_1770 [Paracoccus aminophilus JCM 7686]